MIIPSNQNYNREIQGSEQLPFHLRSLFQAHQNHGVIYSSRLRLDYSASHRNGVEANPKNALVELTSSFANTKGLGSLAWTLGPRKIHVKVTLSSDPTTSYICSRHSKACLPFVQGIGRLLYLQLNSYPSQNCHHTYGCLKLVSRIESFSARCKHPGNHATCRFIVIVLGASRP